MCQDVVPTTSSRILAIQQIDHGQLTWINGEKIGEKERK
jgi:hypothetical protein